MGAVTPENRHFFATHVDIDARPRLKRYYPAVSPELYFLRFAERFSKMKSTEYAKRSHAHLVLCRSKRSSNLARIAKSSRETFEIVPTAAPDEVGKFFWREWEIVTLPRSGSPPVAQTSPPVQHTSPQNCRHLTERTPPSCRRSRATPSGRLLPPHAV